MKKLTTSTLPKTWLIDIDGVIFEHNSHLKSGDILNKNVKELFQQIPSTDSVILLTSRKSMYKDQTIASLRKYGIRFDQLIFELPLGERILINDAKPKGLKTAVAINTKRDKLEKIQIICDDTL